MRRRVRSYLFMLHQDKSYEEEERSYLYMLHLDKSYKEEGELISVYVAPGQ